MSFWLIYILYPRERSSGGYIGITLSVCPVCLFVRLSVQIRVQPTLFFVWHWLTIFGTWVYYHERICRKHSWSRYDLKLELWPQGQIYRDFDMPLCSGLSFFVLWHCHTFLAREWITMVQCVTYIHELCMT